MIMMLSIVFILFLLKRLVDMVRRPLLPMDANTELFGDLLVVARYQAVVSRLQGADPRLATVSYPWLKWVSYLHRPGMASISYSKRLVDVPYAAYAVVASIGGRSSVKLQTRVWSESCGHYVLVTHLPQADDDGEDRPQGEWGHFTAAIKTVWECRYHLGHLNFTEHFAAGARSWGSGMAIRLLGDMVAYCYRSLMTVALVATHGNKAYHAVSWFLGNWGCPVARLAGARHGDYHSRRARRVIGRRAKRLEKRLTRLHLLKLLQWTLGKLLEWVIAR